MKKGKAFKTLTLVCFCFLLASLIAFKSGTFDKYLKKDSEGPHLNNEDLSNVESVQIETPSINAVDTFRVNPTMLSTSKSLIIVDQKVKFPVKIIFPVKDSQHVTHKN